MIIKNLSSVCWLECFGKNAEEMEWELLLVCSGGSVHRSQAWTAHESIAAPPPAWAAQPMGASPQLLLVGLPASWWIVARLLLARRSSPVFSFLNFELQGGVKTVQWPLYISPLSWKWHKAGLFVWPDHTAGGNLVPQPGIEPMPIAVKALCPNNWTARPVPKPSLSWVNSCTHFLVLTFTPTLHQLRWSPYGSPVGLESSPPGQPHGPCPPSPSGFCWRGGVGGERVGGKVNAKGRARWNDQVFSGMPFPYLLPDRPGPPRPALAYLFFLSLYSSCELWCFVHSIHHACSSSSLRSFKADLSLLKAHTIWLSNCISRNLSHR